jgi:hypothetical protein
MYLPEPSYRYTLDSEPTHFGDQLPSSALAVYMESVLNRHREAEYFRFFRRERENRELLEEGLGFEPSRPFIGA